MNYRDWREALIEFWKAKYSDLLRDFNELAVKYNTKNQNINSCLGAYKTMDSTNFEGEVVAVDVNDKSLLIELDGKIKIDFKFESKDAAFFKKFKKGTKVAFKMIYEHE